MKLKCLACEALARLVYLSAAYSPHVVDVELFKIGLHNTPNELRRCLQEKIDTASGQGYNALVLAYGLCGKSTHGLTAREIPVVIPRAHDCITLFLGDRARYKDQFESYPGTYWYVLDYVQRNDGAGTTLSLGAETVGNINAVYEEYVAKYGKDNADYLMEVMGTWQAHYKRAVYINMGVGDGATVEAQTEAEAIRRGWTFERMAGDLVLIKRLLDADWDDDFLVLQPGEQMAMSYDENVIKANQFC